MTDPRKSIPNSVRLELWVKSAGRCEFKGCNKPVWYNSLTLSDGNFADVAHIIGASEDGPRGNSDSDELQIDFSNLMLLCKECHKEIDDTDKKVNFPDDLLRKWKQEHEDRIEIQTSIHHENFKTNIFVFRSKIGERPVPINENSIYHAISPMFPVDKKGISIDFPDFDRTENEEYWNTYAQTINKKVKTAFERGYDNKEIKHLSVFGIGSMPLLMYLGKCIGDTIPVNIFQSHRNIADTNKTWSWQEENYTELSFIINEIKVEYNNKNVIIKLAISDYIQEDKINNIIDDSFSIYEITVSDPSQYVLKSKKHLEKFSREYRMLLNRIQKDHGKDCKIHILFAVPVSIAIECGRVLIPTKDPEIFAYEYYSDKETFKKVLKIN